MQNLAFIWLLFFSSELTLNVQGRSYLGLTRSISWLLMTWLLTSPGHQQPWYWLCRICRSWFYLRKDFKYLCHINVEQWHKMYMFIFPLNNLARKELIRWAHKTFADWCPSVNWALPRQQSPGARVNGSCKISSQSHKICASKCPITLKFNSQLPGTCRISKQSNNFIVQHKAMQ